MYNLTIMKNNREIPSFDEQFPDLNEFILKLVDGYNAGKINSWDDLQKLVNAFFTSARMEQMESILPGWQKMASYADRVTLVHVLCVFLGLYMMPEFLSMTPYQQGLMKWVVLLHDLEKEVKNGKRDHVHAFRSAVTAAKLLPKFGFVTTLEYQTILDLWGEFTRSATTQLDGSSNEVQDNHKIPEILSGIENMFGHNTPPALILKTVLFHLSVNMNQWPPPNPLTADETQRYFDRDILPLLRVMNLGDGEGWAMFEPETRKSQRLDTIHVFDELENLIFT